MGGPIRLPNSYQTQYPIYNPAAAPPSILPPRTDGRTPLDGTRVKLNSPPTKDHAGLVADRTGSDAIKGSNLGNTKATPLVKKKITSRGEVNITNPKTGVTTTYITENGDIVREKNKSSSDSTIWKVLKVAGFILGAILRAL